MELSTATTQTMTTRDIAELTGKEHKHVLRDAKNLFSALKIDSVGYAQNWTHPQNGLTYVEYALCKELTLTLVSGYDHATRYEIIKRWQELENAEPKELSRLEILTMAIESEQKVIALEAKIEEDSSKVSFVEDYVEHGNSKCFRDVAAMIGVKQGYFTKVLMNKSIVYKKGGEYKAYSEFAKYFDVKTGINNYVDDSGQTQQKEYTQLRINSAGIVYFAKRFGNPELKEAAEPPIVHPRHKSALSVVGGVA